MENFTGKAMLTFLLYVCGYFPGLAANVLWMWEAWEVQDGFSFGCLASMLVICGLGPIVLVVLVFIMLHYL